MTFTGNAFSTTPRTVDYFRPALVGVDTDTAAIPAVVVAGSNGHPSGLAVDTVALPFGAGGGLILALSGTDAATETAETILGLAYPIANPTDPKQRLAFGVVYLDALTWTLGAGELGTAAAGLHANLAADDLWADEVSAAGTGITDAGGYLLSNSGNGLAGVLVPSLGASHLIVSVGTGEDAADASLWYAGWSRY